MDLQQYFVNTKGRGILATADEKPENEYVKESTDHGFTKVRV